MKCDICGKEMKNTIGGCYSCDCGFGVNDGVYRPQESTGAYNKHPLIGGNYGWICPICGATVAPYMTYCPLCCPPRKIEITYGGAYNTTDTQYTTTTTTNNGGTND